MSSEIIRPRIQEGVNISEEVIRIIPDLHYNNLIYMCNEGNEYATLALRETYFGPYYHYHDIHWLIHKPLKIFEQIQCKETAFNDLTIYSSYLKEDKKFVEIEKYSDKILYKHKYRWRKIYNIVQGSGRGKTRYQIEDYDGSQ